MLSGGQFASPSAERNNVCNTSPLKLWHNLSNICKKLKDQLQTCRVSYILEHYDSHTYAIKRQLKSKRYSHLDYNSQYLWTEPFKYQKATEYPIWCFKQLLQNHLHTNIHLAPSFIFSFWALPNLTQANTTLLFKEIAYWLFPNTAIFYLIWCQSFMVYKLITKQNFIIPYSVKFPYFVTTRSCLHKPNIIYIINRI